MILPSWVTIGIGSEATVTSWFVQSSGLESLGVCEEGKHLHPAGKVTLCSEQLRELKNQTNCFSLPSALYELSA